jgi:two-component system chemotaxis sensor kinase CheA
MSDVDPSIALYIEETRELLGELEQGLLELETNPDDAARLDACFRAMHTIKGGGAMFGFEEISRFTHDVETVLDRVRTGDLPVSRELLSLTLAAKDHILTLLEASREHPDAHRDASDKLLAAFAAYLPEPSRHVHAVPAASGAATPPPRTRNTPARPSPARPACTGSVFAPPRACC